MTFLASSATALWGSVQTWTARANNAWGSSRVWSSGSSFETDLGNMTTDRNTWQGRANNAYGTSRVWGSGSSFETDLSAMTTDRNNWQSNANNAYGPSRVYGSGSSFETLYNNLLNGLNNPEGLQTGSYSINHNAGGTEVSIGTFTFARSGHFHLSVVASVSGTPTQNNATASLRLAGVVAQTLGVNMGGSNAHNWWHAYAGDVDVSAGQTISLYFNCFVTGNPTTGTCTVHAHFVPNASNHN